MQKIQIVKGDAINVPVAKNSSDTSQSLSDLSVTISQSGADGKVHYAPYVSIQVETNPIHYGFGTVTTALGFIANPGDIITLEGVAEVRGFQCISKTSGSHADLTISVEF